MASGKKVVLLFRILDATLLAALNLLRFLARFVPPRALLAAADYMGYALYYARPGARDYVLEAIRESLPEINDEREITRIAREAFSAPFKAMLDLILLDRHADTILERLILQDEAVTKFDNEKAAGRGVIMYSPHVGAIGIIHSLAARIDRHFTPLVMDPKRTPIPRYLGAMAELSWRVGCDPEVPVFWTGEDTVSKARDHLRRGKSAGLTFDLAGGTVANFFGRPTAIASGIAQIACDTGAVIIPGFLRRNHRPLEYQLFAYPEFSYTLTGDREADVERILNQVIEMGEIIVRQAPGQWIGWFGLRGWRKRAEKILAEKNEADGRMRREALV
jgi:lauroyl/myristoyl acyltransferase